jgi:hypothetical protein
MIYGTRQKIYRVFAGSRLVVTRDKLYVITRERMWHYVIFYVL